MPRCRDKSESCEIISDLFDPDLFDRMFAVTRSPHGAWLLILNNEPLVDRICTSLKGRGFNRLLILGGWKVRKGLSENDFYAYAKVFL
jgi:hypothetical protein